jgi:hypothetical protein
MIFFETRKCLVAVTVTLCLFGCSSISSKPDCEYLLSWSNRLKKQSLVLTPDVKKDILAAESVREKLELLLAAEKSTLERLARLIPELRENVADLDLRERALDVVSALSVLSQKNIGLLKASLQGDMKFPKAEATNQETEALKRVTEEFDQYYRAACGG